MQYVQKAIISSDFITQEIIVEKDEETQIIKNEKEETINARNSKIS